jgi:hypothetical protein
MPADVEIKTTAGSVSVPHAPSDLPVVVDIGKKGRKQIKALRRGEGKLMAEVNSLVQELKSAGTVSSSAQPVVVIVRQKPRAKGLFPFPVG